MIERNCYSINYFEDQGRITSIDLIVYRDNKSYIIRVGTLDYVNQVKLYNKDLDPTLQIENNIYVLEDVSDSDAVCQQLAQVPFADLAQYLTEQVQIPEENIVQ